MSLPRGSLAFVTGDIAGVVRAAAVAFDVPADDLLGPSKAFPVVVYRQVAMAAARELGYSFPCIGRGFGGRDHTTVVHACQRVSENADLSHRATVLAESIQHKPGSLF